jgi:hypothetical protein
MDIFLIVPGEERAHAPAQAVELDRHRKKAAVDAQNGAGHE